MGAFYHFARFVFGTIIHPVLFPKKVYGYKEEPFDGSTVIVCNHISNWDCVIVATCFKGKTYFLCKKEMFSNKFMSWLCTTLGGIKIDRQNPDFTEIKNTLKLLKEGKRLAIFPEGTRNKQQNGELLPLKGGAGMFAFKAKSRIIPVYIDKKTRFLRKNHVFVGEPFTLEEFYGERFCQELSEKINAKLANKIYECKNNLQQELQRKKK